ncbi:hypothetical protein Tco_0077722 [Tanacetum coccineum]
MEGARMSWKPLKDVGSLGRSRKLLETLDASTHGRRPCQDKSVTSSISVSRFKAMASEGDRNVGGASGIVVDENRGREESRQGDKRGRGASRDTVASLAKKMVGVKTSTSELKEQVGVSHQHLEELCSNFA